MASDLRDQVPPAAKAAIYVALALFFLWMFVLRGGGGSAAAPSSEEVLDMSCAELEVSWQEHRRGEWDAPGTFRLLTDQINERC